MDFLISNFDITFSFQSNISDVHDLLSIFDLDILYFLLSFLLYLFQSVFILRLLPNIFLSLPLSHSPILLQLVIQLLFFLIIVLLMFIDHILFVTFILLILQFLLSLSFFIIRYLLHHFLLISSIQLLHL